MYIILGFLLSAIIFGTYRYGKFAGMRLYESFIDLELKVNVIKQLRRKPISETVATTIYIEFNEKGDVKNYNFEPPDPKKFQKNHEYF